MTHETASLKPARRALASTISQRCRLDGEFLLRSGTTATHYFDKYLFESDPSLLRAIARHLAPLVPPDTEVLAGLELGGVPIAVAVSIETGLPVCFVRKEPKAYGTRRLAEGADVFGRRLLVVEDVVTTGGQVVTSTKQLRERGALVERAVCVIDRRTPGRSALDDAGLDLVALFTEADLDSDDEEVAR
jgi:orotate phosphoribosyltransferase